MKKWLKLIIVFSFLFVGCSKEEPVLNRGSQDYIAYYKNIEENEIFYEESNFYQISAELVNKGNNTYNYYIFIDNPKIAMYDIKVLAVEKDVLLADSDTMQASIGIFENSGYSMIPYQVNAAEGFYKGLMLSGETDKDSIVIEMLVSWVGADRNTVYKEFISFTLDLNGIQTSHDDLEGN